MSTLHSGSRCLKDAARLPTLCASLRAPPVLWTLPPRPQPPSRHQQTCAASSVAAPPAEATTSSVIQRLAGDIRSGERSAAEVTEQYLEELHAREPELHSFITVDADGARAQVRLCDDAMRSTPAHEDSVPPPLPAFWPVRSVRSDVQQEVFAHWLRQADMQSMSAEDAFTMRLSKQGPVALQAAEIDRTRISDGASSLGPLAGVPIAVKVSLGTACCPKNGLVSMA